MAILWSKCSGVSVNVVSIPSHPNLAMVLRPSLAPVQKDGTVIKPCPRELQNRLLRTFRLETLIAKHTYLIWSCVPGQELIVC